MGGPVEPAADQDGVHGRGRHAEPVGDLDGAEPLLPPQRNDLAHHWARRPVRLPVRGRGPVEHAARALFAVAVGPLLRGAPRDVVRSAARAGNRPWPTIRRASRSRARGVRAALAWVAWDTKASWWRGDSLDSSTPHPGGLRLSTGQTMSSQHLDQRCPGITTRSAVERDLARAARRRQSQGTRRFRLVLRQQT
jgi:hypothetical protein